MLTRDWKKNQLWAKASLWPAWEEEAEDAMGVVFRPHSRLIWGWGESPAGWLSHSAGHPSNTPVSQESKRIWNRAGTKSPHPTPWTHSAQRPYLYNATPTVTLGESEGSVSIKQHLSQALRQKSSSLQTRILYWPQATLPLMSQEKSVRVKFVVSTEIVFQGNGLTTHFLKEIYYYQYLSRTYNAPDTVLDSRDKTI